MKDTDTKDGEPLGFDFDDIIFDFNRTFCDYYNKESGTSFLFDDILEYRLWLNWGCTREECIERILAFYESREHSRMNPFSDAHGVLSALAKKHPLHIVTARPDSSRDITLKLLDLHFPGIFQSVHFTNQFDNSKKSRSKLSVLEELGVRTFVDDAEHHALEVASSGRRVLMFDKPWNRNCPPHENITRVHSWKEIGTHLGQQ